MTTTRIIKKCSGCGERKPATREYFIKHDGTKTGVTQPCRECHKKRMRVANRKHYKDNRVKELLRTYRAWDKRTGLQFDLTVEWVEENITNKSCHYCGDTEEAIGCDRVDNSIGHVKTNVIPCCGTCNKARNNLFTVDEMEVIGQAIRKVKAKRRQFARL